MKTLRRRALKEAVLFTVFSLVYLAFCLYSAVLWFVCLDVQTEVSYFILLLFPVICLLATIGTTLFAVYFWKDYASCRQKNHADG